MWNKIVLNRQERLKRTKNKKPKFCDQKNKGQKFDDANICHPPHDWFWSLFVTYASPVVSNAYTCKTSLNTFYLSDWDFQILTDWILSFHPHWRGEQVSRYIGTYRLHSSVVWPVHVPRHHKWRPAGENSSSSREQQTRPQKRQDDSGYGLKISSSTSSWSRFRMRYRCP